MTFSTTEDGSVVTLRIGGELDAVSVPDLRATIDGLVAARHREIIVDLEALRLIDSSGVGAIVSLYRRAGEYGGSVRVRNANDQPLAIFRLLKLERILLTEPEPRG
jgi:anti-sigma B factor antagonist